MLKHHIIHQGIQALQIPTKPLVLDTPPAQLAGHNSGPVAHNTAQGYRIDFWTKSQQKQSPLLPQFSADHLQLITEEITELLQKQAIEELQPSEGIHKLKDLLQPGNWLAKVDLKDAFFMISITISTEKVAIIYIPRERLSVHLSPLQAAWVFTKILKPAIVLLRQKEVRLIAYMDAIARGVKRNDSPSPGRGDIFVGKSGVHNQQEV